MGRDRRMGRGSFGVNVERPIVTNGDGDALFPNYFAEDFFTLSACQFLRLRAELHILSCCGDSVRTKTRTNIN